jgi:hypothetical protein
MPDHDHLSSLILEHWTHYHSGMLAEQLRENLLETADPTSCTTWY